MKFIFTSIFGLLVLLLLSWNRVPEKIVAAPEIKDLKFGSITVNNVVYEDDIIISAGEVKKRKKGASKDQREKYGHTPITAAENIPWDCDTLVIGIGMSGRLPVPDEFKEEARKKGVVLVLLETPEAVEYFTKHYRRGMNAVFHITC